MAKGPILGIDIGYDRMKLVLVQGKTIRKFAAVDLPPRLMKDGKVVSIESMGEVIRKAMRENGIRCKAAAMTLSEEVVVTRNITMPYMTEEQLQYNLPFEFRDYLTEDLKKYVFDYGMITKVPKKGKQDPSELFPEGTMELMASACPASVIEDYRSMLRKAGLKLEICAPCVCAYANLIRNLEKVTKQTGEYGILDLGSNTIRFYMYQGDTHKVTRALEIGLKDVEEAVAEVFQEDRETAKSYLKTNYEDCLHAPEVQSRMTAIAVELQRALNFYRFSNQDSNLKDVWICGGGASIPAFVEILKQSLDVDIHFAQELFSGTRVMDDGYLYAEAYGITQQ